MSSLHRMQLRVQAVIGKRSAAYDLLVSRRDIAELEGRGFRLLASPM